MPAEQHKPSYKVTFNFHPVSGEEEVVCGPPIRYMNLRFAFKLGRQELPALRGALVALAGRELDVLHNHLPGSKNYHYRYPLVQYRVVGDRGGLYCMGEGATAMQQILQGEENDVYLNGRPVSLEVDRVNIDYYRPSVSKALRSYAVRDYLPLNQKHEREFRSLDCYSQGGYLTRLLTSHLLAFASGIDWQVPEHVRVELAAVRKLTPIMYKGIAHFAFNIDFRTNVCLPDGMGLGKSVAMGFGVVRPKT